MTYTVTNFWYQMKVTLTDNAANTVNVASVTPGTTTEIQTTAANTLIAGQPVTIAGVTGTIASSINGVHVVASVIDSTHFTVAVNTSSYAYASGGFIVYGNGLALYDPAVNFGTPIFLSRTDIATNPGLVQIAYPLPATTNGFNYADVSTISFAWEGPTPTFPVSWNFYELASSGQFQGTTSFAAAYFSQDTRQIGPATYYPAVNPGASTMGQGVTIADDQRFWYDYRVNIPALPSGALAAGVNHGLLYAQLPGQTQPYLCGEISLGAWNSGSGAWVAVTNVSGGNYANDWGFFLQDLTWPALNPSALCLPTGVAMAATSQRLMVGSGNTLWVSSADRPFQFYALTQSDPSGNLLPQSGTSMQFSGEKIQTLLAIGSLAGGNEGVGDPPVGAATVFVFTDRTVLMLSGWDATSLSKPARMYDQGTYAPWSVATFQTGFMFWGTDGHIVRYGINPQIPYAGMYCYAVSRLIVEDQLKAVPTARVFAACAGVKDECYYLCLSPAGSSQTSPNTFALVYDFNESVRTQDNVWYRDDFPSAVYGVSRLIAYRSGYQTLLMGFDLKGQLLEHVTYGSTADAGLPGVMWSLVFPEVRSDGFRPVLVRRALVHSDSNIGQLSTNRLTQGRLTQVSSSGLVNTGSAFGVLGTRCVRYDNVTAGGATIPGASDTGVTFTLAGTSPSGSVIHGLMIEAAPLTADGPDVS